jgi:hypothetical protein
MSQEIYKFGHNIPNQLETIMVRMGKIGVANIEESINFGGASAMMPFGCI